MRNILSLTACVAFVFNVHFSYAQETCGFEKMHQKLIDQDEAYRKQIAENAIQWSQHAKLQNLQRLIINGLDTVYEIPVVFHVMHTGNPIGGAFNPEDIDLIKCIDYTNAAYAAQIPGFPGPGNGGVRVPFKFVLAKRDPNCMPTTGIVRVDMSANATYVANGVGVGGLDDPDLKSYSVWPNDQYYNVWVVNYIDGPGGGTAGYAYYPGAGPTVDGTVILSTYAVEGTTTLAHEIGHGMGLPHTFEGDAGGTTCPPNNDCTIDGDGICDTEPHIRTISCGTTTNPCTGGPMNFTQHSYMSYSHGCRDRFTAGQRDKMLFNIKTYRSQLIHSLGGVEPPEAPISTVCTPSAANPTSPFDAGPRHVIFGNINNESGGFTSSGNIAYTDYFCSQRTEVFLGETYPISITTGQEPEYVRVYIDYNNDGVFDPMTEEVYASNGNITNQVHTGDITIPATDVVICQPLRMRVVTDVTGINVPTPCGILQHGQGEDYVVIVKPHTGAEVTIQPVSTYPYCKDSVIVFSASTISVPPDSAITWFINGIPVAQGTTFAYDKFAPGDILQAVTTVMNTVCGTPDSIHSNRIVIDQLPPAMPTPVISLIGNLLISNITPIQWYHNDTLIPGANNSTYHPTEFGYYHAVLTALPCPSEPSNVLNVSLLPVGEYDMNLLKIYPNPAQETVTLDWGFAPASVSIVIYNTLGQALIQQEVTHTQKHSISLHSLSDGIYFLRITDKMGNSGITKLQVLR